MTIRLQTLGLTDFMAHKDRDEEFTTPVTLFAGPNGAGKSTIADAIQVLFLGTARGLQKKDRSALARGLEGFKVVGRVRVREDEHQFRATQNSQAPTRSWINEQLASDDLLACLTDWRAWLRLPVERRRKTVLSLTSAAKWGGKPLPREIEETRRAKGPSKALQAAIERRREISRLIKESGVSEPRAVRDVGGVMVDLSKLTREELERKKRALREERATMQRQEIDAAVLSPAGDERVALLRSEAEQLEALEEAAAGPQGGYDQACKAAERVNRDDQALARDAEALESQLTSLRRAASVGEKCPACLRKIDDAHVKSVEGFVAKKQAELNAIGERRAALRMQLADTRAAVEEASRQRRRAEDAVRSARSAKEELQQLMRQRKAAKEAGVDPQSLKARSAQLQADEDLITAQLAALGTLDAERERYQRDLAKIAKWQKDVDDYETAQKELEEYIASGAGDAMAVLGKRAQDFAAAFGWTLEWDAQLLPRVNDIPYALACRSDRYLLAAAVQYALARVSGLAFMVLDDMDMVTPARRQKLLAWMSEQDGMQVIGMSAVDESKSMQKGRVRVVAL